MPPTSAVEFENLQEVEETLAAAALADTPDYVTVKRVDGKAMPTVGRRSWNRMDLANYLGDDADGAHGGDDLGSLWDAPAVAASSEPEHRLLAHAVVQWLRELARGQLGPDADVVTFKVELRSPKGADCLCAPRFRARRTGNAAATPRPETEATLLGGSLEPTLKVQELPLPAAPRHGAIVDPGVSAWQALNEGIHSLLAGHHRSMALLQAGYTHQMRLTLAMLSDMRSVSSSNVQVLIEQVARQATQLGDRDKVIVRLSDELLGFRIELATIGLGIQNDAQSGKERMALAEKALGQVGHLGELYLAGKLNIPPELGTLLMELQEYPEVMALLKDPRLVVMFKDPSIRAQVVDILSTLIQAAPADSPPPSNEARPDANQAPA